MAKHAQSISRKKKLAREEQERAIAHAMQAYRIELVKPDAERKPLKAVCREVAEEWRENGKPVVVSADTVRRRLDGGRSHSQFNSETNAWLVPEEEDSVVEYCLALAKRGFPLNHKRLKFHVDSLLRVRLGDSFPEKGVGKSWTDVRH